MIKLLRKKHPDNSLSLPQCQSIRQNAYYNDKPNKRYRCTRKAYVRIKGINYCSQHGGLMAIGMLVEMEGKK